MRPIKLKKIRADIENQVEKLSQDGFKQIFNRIDQFNIKKGVDRMGLDRFIDQCAFLAAGSGAISGSGGMFTLIVGVPLDFANLIMQQFRVTMAINYYHRGSYQMDFEEFFKLIATSFKVDAGITVTKTMMEAVAEKMLLILGTRTAERLVPIVGGVIGGTANYLFIKRMAKSVKQMHPGHDPEPIQVF